MSRQQPQQTAHLAVKYPTAEIHSRSSQRYVSRLQLFRMRTTPFNHSRAYRPAASKIYKTSERQEGCGLALPEAALLPSLSGSSQVKMM